MYELYSQRIKNKGGEAEIYFYDSFSSQFRNQLFYIVSDVYDLLEHSYSRESWKYLHDSFARELGVKRLNRFYDSYGQEKRSIEGFLTEAPETEILDFIDFTFAVIDRLMKQPDLSGRRDLLTQFEKAIGELNHRFRQHRLGYEFIRGEIIRKDNELIHQQIVKPALHFLAGEGFEEAEEQLLQAFEQRRKGAHEEAVRTGAKALESTIRSICVKSGYPLKGKEERAGELLAVLERSGFFPAQGKASMEAVRCILQSGFPAHDLAVQEDGSEAKGADECSEYALNLTAASILLLTRLHAAGPKD